MSRHTAGDLDLGVMVRVGALRVGGTLKHVGEPGFGDGRERIVLGRQGRVGVAVKKGKTGVLSSLIGAVDVDVTTRTTVLGDERRVAAGGEIRTVQQSRCSCAAGVSANTQGTQPRQPSAGTSIALRTGCLRGCRAGAGVVLRVDADRVERVAPHGVLSQRCLSALAQTGPDIRCRFVLASSC